MKLIDYVKELEGKPHDERKRAVCKSLKDLGLDYEIQKYDSGENIIVSSGKEKEIGISSHYDAVTNSPGANDNGSAVAVTLDILRRYKESSLKNIGVRGLIFDEEELGLVGSRAYVKDRGLKGLIGLYNMELVGHGDMIAFWADEKLEDGILLSMIEKQAKEKRIPTYRFPYIGKILDNSGDHQSFNEAGFSEAFCLTSIDGKDLELALKYLTGPNVYLLANELMAQSNLFKNYHKPTDTLEHLDEKTLKMVSDLLWDSMTEIDRKYN